MAEPDAREMILDRLFAVLLDLGVGVGATVKQNERRGDDDQLPLIIMLDGDEDIEESGLFIGRPANAPLRMLMIPIVFLSVSGEPEQIRPRREALRRRIIKAVTEDAELIRLTGEDPLGSIRYLGLATGLQEGAEIFGDMGLNFAFGYVLRPAQL